MEISVDGTLTVDVYDVSFSNLPPEMWWWYYINPMRGSFVQWRDPQMMQRFSFSQVAINSFISAGDSFRAKGSFSDECKKTLAALGTDIGTLKARRPVIIDGTFNNTLYWTLYSPNLQAAAKAGPDGMKPISQVMREDLGTKAMSEAGGNTIYINPNLVNFSTGSENIATYIHEVIHNATGLLDPDIQRALNLPEGHGTKNISDLLQKQCVEK